MNIAQMHLELRQALDKVNSSAYPELLPEQLDYFLNEAQMRFVKTRYSGNNLFKASFEQMQKRTDDLSKIVVTRFGSLTPLVYEPTTYTSSLNVLYNDEACTDPADEKYMLFINGRCKTSKTNCAGKYNTLRIYSHDELNVVRKNPFRKPVLSEPIAYFEEGSLNVITDGNFNADVLAITYIKVPVEMKYGTQYPTPSTDVNCELAEHTHKEIIQIAVQVILENIESQRLQTQVLNIQTQE